MADFQTLVGIAIAIEFQTLVGIAFSSKSTHRAALSYFASPSFLNLFSSPTCVNAYTITCLRAYTFTRSDLDVPKLLKAHAGQIVNRHDSTHGGAAQYANESIHVTILI